MGGSSPKIKAPKADYGSDITSLLNPLSQQIGNIAQFEGQNRPAFGNLNLGDIQTFFQGGGNQQGILGLGGQAYETGVGQQLAAQQQQLAGQQGQVQGLRQLQAGLSPEAAMATQQASDAARTAYAASLGVTPEEQRMAQQAAREAAQSSGRLGDNSTVAAEVLGRSDIMARKRAEAAQAGNQAFQLGQSFYQQPGLQALYSTPAGMQIGQNYLNYGVQSIGQSTPQLFDVGQALNLGAAQRQNQLSAAQANAQAKAQNKASTMGLIGTIAGVAAAPFTGGASLALTGLGSALSKAGGSFGSSGLYNTGAGLYNSSIGAGTPPKAYIA
jgi:hypothetical protein